MTGTSFMSQQAAATRSRSSTRKRSTHSGRLSSSHEEREDGEESLVAMIPFGNRVWGIALDPSGTKLYTANGTSNDVPLSI
jgi:DNA-binding beta-propeller fold protein YncE